MIGLASLAKLIRKFILRFYTKVTNVRIESASQGRHGWDLSEDGYMSACGE
jgi:hypothetical protein